MDNDSWSLEEWWFWRRLDPWDATPPPPHNGCGCTVWISIGAIAAFILGWLLPLLF